MKSFLKYTLATIVGILLVNMFMFLIFVGLIGAIAAMSDKSIEVKDNSLLVIRLENEILDRVTDNPLENIDFLTMTPKKSLGMNKILSSIKRAAKDNRIIGIYLDLTDIQGNFGALAFTEEIRNALQKFKESGKFIYSYSNLGYSQKSYYLATVADKIYVNPETPLLLSGMSSSISFYKETLAKLGIQPEVVKVGKFKSAVEPFISNEMSEANREQVKKYLDSSWGTLVKGISESRNIPADSINALTNRFNIYTCEQLKDYGYFDDVIYEDQMLTILKKKCHPEAAGDSSRLNHSKLNQVLLSDYQNIPLPETDKLNKGKIAVIYAQGEIGMEQSANSIGPDLAKTIRKVRENDKIKAVVLRVNSPGGSALTSDIIWRETELLRKTKPLIVSMGNVAASGGYYISCAADTIVAEPTTLTGSIGIFGLFFSGEKLIKDKIGITTEVVKTNTHSDFGGSYPLPLPISSRPLTPYERNVLQNYVNRGYETFLNRVMEGRGFTRDELHAIAQGRVWTGADALKIGLVDVLGGLEDALQIAAVKAGLENYSLTEYPVLKNPIEEFFNGLTGSVKTRLLKEELGDFYPTWNQIKNRIQQQGLMARIPYDLVPN
ncbi:signal peptide peptidase SppA [Odoribacter sp. Z80]|uniref:signal peptide peptidase SppA n=1 Tax=Odoribacter sp. Z80 TaxID=2304575 RepID=UPI00137A8E95|nr:signal peptide peptidase SppA [Odoribacter sp. Z80]NCE71916.1 signal peptide peptidase SppA [Odoribacter sp. Z80]